MYGKPESMYGKNIVVVRGINGDSNSICAMSSKLYIQNVSDTNIKICAESNISAERQSGGGETFVGYDTYMIVNINDGPDDSQYLSYNHSGRSYTFIKDITPISYPITIRIRARFVAYSYIAYGPSTTNSYLTATNTDVTLTFPSIYNNSTYNFITTPRITITDASHTNYTSGFYSNWDGWASNIGNPGIMLLPSATSNNLQNGKIIYIKACTPSIVYSLSGKAIERVSTTSETNLYNFGDSYGFYMGKNHACTLLYNENVWHILTYYNGSLPGPYIGYSSLNINSNTYTTIDKSVAVCDYKNGNKYVRLPPAAGSLKLIYIIGYSSSGSNSTNNIVNVISQDNNNIIDNENSFNSIFIRSDNGNKNGCVTFVSDNTSWWVLDASDCVGITFDNLTSPIPTEYTPTAPFVLLMDVNTTNNVTFQSLSTLSSSIGKIHYIKQNFNTSQNGVVLYSDTGSYLGSIMNNRIYAPYWTNFTCATVVGLNIESTFIYFLISYYSS